MSEHKEPIPSMIYNAAVGGHVTSSQQIIDENENKEQSQINAEVTQAIGQGGSVDSRIIQAKNDIIGGASSNGNTLKKIEDRVSPLESAVGTGGSVDSRISSAVNAAKSEIKGSATSACDTLGEAEALISANTTAISEEAARAQIAEGALQQLYENLTQSNIVVVEDHTQVTSPSANIIYREKSINTYSDWMWYNNAWQKMAEYDNAIDDEPIAGSNNLVKSRGVALDANIAHVALGFAPKMYLGKWYSDTTGILEDSTIYDCTELIEVKGNDNFIYPNLRANRVACFDANKQFLGVGATYMILLPNTKYFSLVFLKKDNYDYKTLSIKFYNRLLDYNDIKDSLSDYIFLNAAVNSTTGNLEYFDTLDCTPKIKVGENTKYLYMNAKYFDVTCWAADGTRLGSIKSVIPAQSSKIGYTLIDNTAYVSVCFLKSDNIDYSKLRIYSDEEEYRKELINNEGLKPFIYYGKAYNPANGNLENFPSDLDCTNLIKVESGISDYENAVKVNQNISAVFQICCFDASYNLLGRTPGKSFKLLDNTVYFSVSFLKNKNVDYTNLLIGIDVVNDIVIPTPKRGLKYYLFGDSITYYDNIAWAHDPNYFMIAYPSYIRNVLKAEVSNNGVAGDPSKSITTRLLATNLSDAYAVTYMAGTNDLVQNIPIGSLGTLDRDTYIGNLEVGLRYVLENYPQVKFYFIAPCFAKNRNIAPYCEAMQSVANAYGIPIIRWDLVGGINKVNVDYFIFDGIHPNNLGHKRFADALIPFLQNY